jgi:hypothetical protein
LFVVNQQMRTHLLGQRREEKPHTNLLRQWSSSMNALLPFGTQVFGFSANFVGRKEETWSKSAKDMLSLDCKYVACDGSPSVGGIVGCSRTWLSSSPLHWPSTALQAKL